MKIFWLRYLLMFFVIGMSHFGYSQLTLVVNSIPSNTPLDAKIYIAGNFNNWNPGDVSYELVKQADQTYKITFTPNVGTLKFKFTQGDWPSVEGTSTGGFIPDRTYNYTGGVKNIELSILGWEGKSNITSTATANVSILSDAFFIPQLNKNRRIWVYTPPNYNSTTDSFPVLYMHDGQNLFDRITSFSGEWGVDEALDSLYKVGHKVCIVVGIDNGGGARLDEYSPWVNPQYGGGKGDLYLEFIIKSLMPEIESKFRALKGPENTGIMGSSMGGLISMYGGLKYPNIFGKVGAFSSSYWFSNESFKQSSQVSISIEQLHYLIAGAKEGGSQIGDMNKIAMALIENGLPTENIISLAHNDANHSEWYWRREFPEAFKFLFEKKTSSLNDNPEPFDLSFTQIDNQLTFKNLSSKSTSVNIYTTSGALVSTGTVDSKNNYHLDPSFSKGGIFIIQLYASTVTSSKLVYIHPF